MKGGVINGMVKWPPVLPLTCLSPLDLQHLPVAKAFSFKQARVTGQNTCTYAGILMTALERSGRDDD